MTRWRRQCFTYHPVIGRWYIPNLRARIPHRRATATVQPGSFYAMELVRQVGGVRPQFYIAMDRDLWLRLLQVGDGWHVGTQVARFRRHDRAKSSEPPSRFLEETLAPNQEFGTRLFGRQTFQVAKTQLRCIVARIRHRIGVG